MKTVLSTDDSLVSRGNYPVTQVDGEDGLLPLLQEENDHEGEGVGGDSAFSLAVNVAQLEREEKRRLCLTPTGQPSATAIRATRLSSSRGRLYPSPVAEGQHQGDQPWLQFSQSCQVIGGQAGHVVPCGHLTEQAAAEKPRFNKQQRGKGHK